MKASIISLNFPRALDLYFGIIATNKNRIKPIKLAANIMMNRLKSAIPEMSSPAFKDSAPLINLAYVNLGS